MMSWHGNLLYNNNNNWWIERQKWNKKFRIREKKKKWCEDSEKDRRPLYVYV